MDNDAVKQEPSNPGSSKSPPTTPKKKTTSPSAKKALMSSPAESKDQVREKKRIALEALFEYGVRGETKAAIAEKSGLNKKQVEDLFRPGRANIRMKVMGLYDSGSL